jgi:predicted phosphodiesterase
MIGEDAGQFAEVTEDFFEKVFIYSCKLENLKPESLYNFRIISNERATSWQNLRTAGNGNFQMLIFSDSQCVNYKVWKNTADTAAKNFPDAEIFAVNGDLVDNESYKQWREWFNAAENILHERIFAPVMGNHEFYNEKWLNCLPTNFLKNFKLPPNGNKKFDGYFYSFNYGAAHFFILNTQFIELENLKAGMQEAQEYWLKNDAMSVNRRWKIVLMHKPIYNRMQTDFVDEAKNYFLSLFDELEIDLVLTGHLHTYRNRGKIFEQKQSERGTTYILCGRAGDQNYNREAESYICLDISADSINLICQTVDGKILDSFILSKFS